MKRAVGRHIPSIANLIALTTVARTANVTRAAEELFLTQSAVSRQIKDLEDFVGKELFNRSNGEMTLTAEGRKYVEVVALALSQLEEATLGLSSSVADQVRIVISSQTTLAVKWLFPRLASFSQMHPNIIVDLETHLGQPDPKRSSADMLILFREDPEPGWLADRLLNGGGYPVCAPSLLKEHQLNGVEALTQLPLLHQRSHLEAWSQYFADIGLANVRPRPGPTYSLLTMGLQAALAGMGIAILPDFVVHEDLQAARLVRVHNVALKKKASYMLMTRARSAKSAALELFRSWILLEAQSDSSQS